MAKKCVVLFERPLTLNLTFEEEHRAGSSLILLISSINYFEFKVRFELLSSPARLL